MANLQTVAFKGNKILVTLELNQEEYGVVSPRSRNFVLVPTAEMPDKLVTGKLGNSNRIMMPNKVLKRYGIPAMPKHVRSTIIRANGGIWLVVDLEKQRAGIPEFEQVQE